MVDAFVSYAGEDEELAEKFKSILKKEANLEAYIAKDEPEPGRYLRNKYRDKIREANFMVSIVTIDYLKKVWGSSDVAFEYDEAKLQGKKILPLWIKTSKEIIQEIKSHFLVRLILNVLKLYFLIRKIPMRELKI
jgi:hypothetical protein